MKVNLKKLLPILGIVGFGIAGATTATALAIKNLNNNRNNEASLNQRLMNYAFNNLINYDILVNPTELSNYLYDYGVFGYVDTNPVQSVNVKSMSVNNDGYYNAEIELISSNDSFSNTTYTCTTSIKQVTNISNINFSQLENYFSTTINNPLTAYKLIYNSSDALLNLLTSYTNIKSEWVDSVSINLSNEFNNSVSDLLAFDLTINLNDEYIYNNSHIINVKLTSAYKIDWEQASNTASLYFTFDDSGTITGITDLGLQQELLIVPQFYKNSNWDTNQIYNIESLIPSDNNIVKTSNVKIVILPNSIKTIGDNAFGNSSKSSLSYTNLKWINLPSSLSSIGSQAFANCSNLQNLDFQSQEYLSIIDTNAFYNCDSFTNLFMNDKLSIVNDFAFDNCNNLKNVRLSRHLTKISNVLFGSSSKLTSLVIPYGVTSIGNQAFSYSGLKYVNIPYTVSYVDERAFNSFAGNNMVFLDRQIKNGIMFKGTIFGKSVNNSNLNVYILGEYDSGNYFWLSFWYCSFNIYVNSSKTYGAIVGGGNNLDANRLVIMDNDNLPYPQINNVDKFISHVQENVNSIDDIISIFNDSNYVKNLAKTFNMFYNYNWISSFSLSGVNNNDYISSLSFEIILWDGLTYNIDVNLLKPIYAPQAKYFDNSGNFILNNDILSSLKNVVNSFFKQYANTYSSNNLATILGGDNYVNELYSLLNEQIQILTDGYVKLEISKNNVYGGTGAWSNGDNGYKTMDIGFGFSTNKIFVPDNDLNIVIKNFGNVNWVVFNDIETNVENS